ncbi:hypothetical protein [Rhizobium sp. ZX09]|uniref:hypothetical protein n=1 Tax=Rhizobium sp. ZX09 TaxID=2291939 RepID=UPI001A99A367|nr:hypothetical protein [Rhizobium sp. ZX09]QSZ57234.1 hypothetical protein BTN45_09035 [Rhizobium sp. ZX09]
MTGMSPVIEQLQDCRTDAERARWLLNIPTFIFYREQTAIYRVLRQVGFVRGTQLVDLEISALVTVRDRFGRLPTDVQDMLNGARTFMETLARKGGVK